MDTVRTAAADSAEDLVLRRAAAQDFEAFLALKSEQANIHWSGHVASPDGPRLRSWFETLPASRDLLIAEAAGVVVGYLYMDRPASGGAPIEVSIGVGERHRNRGLATAMLAAAMGRYPGRRFAAWIFLDNGASIKAFQRAGFARLPDIEPRRVARRDSPDGAEQGLWLCPEAADGTHAADTGDTGSADRRPAIAFTYADLEALADWRERLYWPLDVAALRAQGARAIRVCVDAIRETTDARDRQILVVAVGRVVNRFQTLAEAALIAQAAEQDGLVLAGGPPELARLTGEGPGGRTTDHDPAKGLAAIRPPDRALLRGLIRTASYTPRMRLPAALLGRDGVAVSHNRLMLQTLSLQSRAVRFHHAASIVAGLRGQAQRSRHDPAPIRPLIERLCALCASLNDSFRALLAETLMADLTPALARIAADIDALRSRGRLPMHLWSGTNGAYATRLIASEVLRRGGEVDGFDHGGVTGISQLAELTAVVELLTTSRFTVATQTWRDLVVESGAPALGATVNESRIAAGHGEPTFSDAFRDTPPAAEGRLKVIYVGHPYRGLRQFAISAIPDSIYWEFQERLVRALSAMPIELLCKPHPEGFFRGQKVPIESLAPTSYRRFEEHLDDADVFLFDAPTSTTFMEALCTRRRVVLLDRGHYPLSEAVASHAAERCRIVPTGVDGRGRLTFDTAALEEAIRAPGPVPNPDWFRRLLVGDVA